MKKSISISALGIIIALQTTAAFAGHQLYPASMCVRWNSSDVVPALGNSVIYNRSSFREMRVDCPILHQNFSNTSGNNIDDADIGIIDRHPARNANCWLTARYMVGSTKYGSSGGARSSSGHGNHEQNRDFGPTGRHSQNWYFIGCIVPRTYNNQASGITYYSARD
jgi:hypothetical protein